jgi:hypothetical protein
MKYTSWVIGILAITAIVIYANINPAKHYFPRCPLLVLTGFKCPGCGSQRALYCLLHGQWLQAIAFNPLMVLCLPYIIIGMLKEYTSLFANHQQLLHKFYGYTASKLLFIIVIVYFISRNIFSF